MLGLRLLGYLALVSPSDAGFAEGFGGSAFMLVGPLEIGASAQGETVLFDYNRIGMASHLGLRVPIDRFELDAAGTLGYGEMTNGGPGLLTDDPGASGDGAFVGARAGVEYAVYRTESGDARVTLGVVGSYEHDLSQYTQEYSYETSGWFSDETTLEQGSARIGMDRYALLIAAGVGFN